MTQSEIAIEQVKDFLQAKGALTNALDIEELHHLLTRVAHSGFLDATNQMNNIKFPLVK
jgi:hypothetical protein